MRHDDDGNTLHCRIVEATAQVNGQVLIATTAPWNVETGVASEQGPRQFLIDPKDGVPFFVDNGESIGFLFGPINGRIEPAGCIDEHEAKRVRTRLCLDPTIVRDAECQLDNHVGKIVSLGFDQHNYISVEMALEQTVDGETTKKKVTITSGTKGFGVGLTSDGELTLIFGTISVVVLATTVLDRLLLNIGE
jgi:hypothetical protein